MERKWPGHVIVGIILMVAALGSALYSNYLSREQLRIMQKEFPEKQVPITEPGPNSDLPAQRVKVNPLPSILGLISSIVLVAGLLIAVGIVPFRSRRSNVTSGHGLQIESAKWRCTVREDISKDVTKFLQGKVGGDRLKIHAHDSVFGDVCELHGLPGHPKSLEVDFSYGMHATASHGEWLSLPPSKVGELSESKTEAVKDTGIALSIVEGVLSDRASISHMDRDIFLFLRVRVLSTQRRETRIVDWKLALYFGGQLYCPAHKDRISEELQFSRANSNVPHAIKEWERIDEIYAHEAFPLNSEKEGWIVFKLIAKQPHHVYGADFHLKAIDDLGKEHTITQHPSAWLNPGVVQWPS